MADFEQKYFAIGFLAKFGGVLSIAIAALPLGIAVWEATNGSSWVWLPVAAIVSALLFLVVRSYVEIVRIVSDTFLPKY